jgi:hypothetical protein
LLGFVFHEFRVEKATFQSEVFSPFHQIRRNRFANNFYNDLSAVPANQDVRVVVNAKC